MPRATALGAVLVASILIVSALGLLSVVAPAASHPTVELSPESVSTPATPSVTSGGPLGPSHSASVQSVADDSSPNVQKAIAAALADGPNGRLMSLPRAPATPAEVSKAKAQGYVSPLYTNAPAPMGIADYGLSSGAGGTVVPTILNTTELNGTFTTTGAGLLATSYTYFTSPGGFSVQQNAFLTNVTIWGNDTFSYWTQNTIYYNQVLGEGTLVSDTWNFTNEDSYTLPSSILSHGPYGSIQPGDALYFTVGPTIPLTYPFSISFASQSFVNSTNGGEEELAYSDYITNGDGTTLYNFPDWDYVVFNSTGGGAAPISQPSNFTANGFSYNGVGLTNDFELDAGGPGGGSQVDLFTADATFSLDYYNATASALQPVPSALNYGGETGETLTGGTVNWAGAAGSEYAVMTTGPSILNGLWNTTTASGSVPVTLDVTPTNAFVYVNPTVGNFFVSTFPEWAPLVDTTTVYLSPGLDYDVDVGLSNYDPTEVETGTLTSAQTLPVALAADSSAGIYTPLWAWSNAQLASISSSGAGSPSDPYVLVNDQSAPIDSIFAIWNDWTYPVYSGVFLMGTTASVEIIDAAPMTVAEPYLGVPATNWMPYWFFDVQNVEVFDSAIQPTWYLDLLEVEYLEYYAETPADLAFWDSSNNLVADNLIDYTVQGISLVGGTGNTFWGNTIVAVNPPPTEIAYPAAPPFNGIMEDEAGDLIYNNAFLDPYYWYPYVAISPDYSIFSGAPLVNLDTWNVTPTAASVVSHAAGYPQVPLVGSIAFTPWQGGNFWSDYGQPWNPLYTPYTEDGYIEDGADYAPLPPGSLVGNVSTLEFTESGLPAGVPWSIWVNGWEIVSPTSEISFFLTNGSYSYTVGAVTGYTASPSAGTPVVTGSTQTIPIQFASTSGTIAGTVTPATASVSVDGTGAPVTAGAFSVTVTAGLHSIVASAPGYATYYTNVSVAGGATDTLTISLTSDVGYLAGTVSPASATVTVDGTTVTVTNGAFNVTLTTGSHALEVSASGYVSYASLVQIAGSKTTSESITLSTSSTSPASTYLSPLAYGLIGVLALLAIVFLVIAATRGRRGPPPAQSWSPGSAPPTSPPPGSQP